MTTSQADPRLPGARHALVSAMLLLGLLGSGLATRATAATIARADSLWRADARPQALACLDSVRIAASSAADTTTWVASLTRRSQFLKQDDRPTAAEAAARRAIALATATGDTALACAPRRWLGVALTAQGRNREAAAEYRRLAALAAAVSDTAHAAWAAVGLGWDADLQRDHAAARDHYGRAATLFAATGDGEGELWAQLGEANAWFHLGHYDTASRGWDRVARLAGDQGLARHEAITRNNIAGLQFALGRPDISRRHYERAVAIWDSLGQAWERMPPALNLGSCLALLGQVDRAEALFTRELAACRESGYTDYEARALRKLADLARDQGDLATAAQRYREALALGDDRPALERLDGLLGLASLDELSGAHVHALANLAHADSLLASDLTSQARIRLDLARARSLLALGRTGPAATLLARVDTLLGDARARFGLELELRRAELCAARGDTLGECTALERAATTWERERGLPLDPDWRAERGAAGREVFVRLGRRLARATGPTSAFDRLQAAKARALQERVRGPGAAPADTAAPAPVTVARLRREVLRGDDLLLDVHLSPGAGLLFAVTDDTCLAVDLRDPAALVARVEAWGDRLADPTTPASRADATADTLRHELLAPLADLLAGARRVIVAPDGPLGQIPLAALDGRSERTWIRVPSAGLWHDLQTRPAATGRGAPGRLTILLADTSSTRPLPGAAWQAEHLAATYAPVACRHGRLGREALAGLGGSVLHVGAHVRADGRNAWQSAILLGDAPADELRAADVVGARVSTPLVVLASCASAGGRVLAGEGVQGLAQAFLAAGARAVVATLWPVDDDQAAVFMAHFYAHLADGLPAGEALAAARVAMRGDPATAHPFAWAGFVLLGDGDLTVPLAATGPALRSGWWAPLVLAVVLIVVVGWWWRSERSRLPRR